MSHEFIELDHDLLENRNLPLKPEPYSLEGQRVKVSVLDQNRDSNALFEITSRSSQIESSESECISNNDLIWEYQPFGPFLSLPEFEQYLQELNQPDSQVFCVTDLEQNRQIGLLCLLYHHPEDLKIQIGEGWFDPSYHKIEGVFEAIYLILDKLFEKRYRRVEAKCHKLDIRSKNIFEGFGFNFEGVKRNQYIYKGISTDIAWYYILDYEWAEIRDSIRKKLYIERN